MQNEYSPVAPEAQAPPTLQPPVLEPRLAEPPNDVPAVASGPIPPPAPAGFCRTCGRGLTQETRREALGTIYCPDHVPAAGAPEPPSPYAAMPAPASQADQGPPAGLAFVLGFVPGVGAIYNAQYAKGFIHVVIFGLLISIASSRNLSGGLEPLFGLMAGVFVFYQCFEAYHTAKKRQLGIPVDEWSSLIPMGTPGTAAAAIGPGLLIVLGILFLLNNFDLLPVGRLLKFWPVLLIGAGAVMLLNRMKSSQGDRS